LKRLYVVVGIIKKDGKFCIAKRKEGAHLGGLWEFPGGKVETHEEPFPALQRELFEELGIKVLQAEPLTQFTHDYSDRLVLLDFWLVTDFDGEPMGQEGQQVKWVSLEELNEHQFPQANHKVFSLLK
jgi:8-oxo-dGTP diphosphatase